MIMKVVQQSHNEIQLNFLYLYLKLLNGNTYALFVVTRIYKKFTFVKKVLDQPLVKCFVVFDLYIS